MSYALVYAAGLLTQFAALFWFLVLTEEEPFPTTEVPGESEEEMK